MLRARFFFLAAFLLAFPAFGQTDRGAITGTVSDPSGAVVANAPLELVNTETGALYQAATSETGNYTFGQLPVGTYRLSVTVPGFKTYIRENLTVAALQTVRQDIALEVGTAAESVTVTAEVSLLKTESGEVSYGAKGSRLTSLPILPIGAGFSSTHGVRNPMAVAGLAPGTYFDPNLNVRVNGAPSNTESIRIDGQDSTNGVVTFAQAQTQPSVEALEELTIQTSNYAAEFGQAGAGLFNYTTKSGTNAWHGSLYDYNSNEFYNASQAYTHNKPLQRRDNYGGTFSGPVWIPKVYNGRDRTFFFWNYEVFREKGRILNQFPTVPTQAYRDGIFTTALSGRAIAGNPVDSLGRPAIDGQIFDPKSEFRDAQGRRLRNPYPNNTIPLTEFDEVAKRVMNLIPRPNGAGLVNNYNNPFITDRNTNIPALKLDHNLSAKQKLSFYWSTTETAVQYCIPLCGSEGLPDPITATRGTFIESYTLRLNYDYTLTPTVLLHLGSGFLSNDFKDTAPVTNYDVEKELGIRGAPAGPNNGGRFPVFVNMLGSNSQGGMNNMGPVAGQVRAIEQKPTFNASLSWVKGNHTFKFGGDARIEGFIDYTFTDTTGRFSFSAAETGNPYFSDAGIAINGGQVGFPFASFLLGRVNQVNLSALPAMRGGRKYLAFFAQDTWKVTRKLTLDYGLRYDYATYAKEQYGRTPAFSPNVANATAGGHLGGTIFEATCGCNFAKNYPHAWGPRVGVAYQIDPKTVFRVGFGISYALVLAGSRQGAAGANLTANVPAPGDPAMILGQGYFPLNPVWPDLRANLFPDSRTFSGQPAVFDQNAGRPSRQMQWSVGIQREILRDLIVEVQYVGNRGAWWRTNSLAPYNVLTLERLQRYGLDIMSAADRAILSAQVGAAAAGRFRNQFPFSGAPSNFSVARTLTDFPQFGTLTGFGPLGRTWYDALQMQVTKRLSHGLDLTYSFSYQKELQLGAESDAGGGVVNDIMNRNTNKQWSSFSQPLTSIIALNYTLPRWSSNRWVNYVASDWTLGTVLQYRSGLPILIPQTADATSNLGTALLRGTRAERVPGVPLFLKDLNCHCFDPAQTQVLNPAAWRDPVPGTFTPSAMYYNDYRFQRRPRETLSFGRIFRIGERAQLWIRAEFTNPFNRTQVPNPVINGYKTGITQATINVQGTPLRVNNTGFGVIATLPPTAVIGERSGLLVGRLTF